MKFEDMNIVKKMIAKLLNINEDDIKNDFNLIEAGINSMSFIKLIIDIENYFSFEFDDEDLDIFKLQSFDNLINYINKRRM